MEHAHKSHKALVKRLKRADGHLQSVVRMIEEGRPCPDVLQQMSAVIAALNKVRKLYFEDHLQCCVGKAVVDGDAKAVLADLQQMLKMVMP